MKRTAQPAVFPAGELALSLKLYFARLFTIGQLKYGPGKGVKLVGEQITPPRHLDDREEQALRSSSSCLVEIGPRRERERENQKQLEGICEEKRRWFSKQQYHGS